MTRLMTGGCMCGAVRFEVSAPASDLYHCHCSMCRKMHGTAFATYAVVAKSAMALTRGEDNLSSFKSSPGVSRSFCRTCGCQILIDVAEEPDNRWFMPAILDDPVHPGAAQRERHIFVGSMIPWLHLDPVLPRSEEA